MKSWKWRSAAPKLGIQEQFIRCGRKILFCAFEIHFGRNIPARALGRQPSHLCKALPLSVKRRSENISRRRAGSNGNGGAAVRPPFACASVVSRDRAGGFGAFRRKALLGNCALANRSADSRGSWRAYGAAAGSESRLRFLFFCNGLGDRRAGRN